MSRVNLDKIKSDRIFQDLALLLDNEECQKELAKLEKEVNKSKEFNDLGDFLFNDKSLDLAWSIVKKFQYPPGFTTAVISAAEKGIVTPTDTLKCYTRVVMLPQFPEGLNHPLTKDEVVIAIYPQMIKGNRKSIIGDIRQALDEAQSQIVPLPPRHPLVIDVQPSIRLKRKLYLERKIHKTPSDMLAEIFHIAESTVDEYVSDYSKLLKFVV